MAIRLETRGSLFVLLAALLWSTGGVCIKSLTGYQPFTVAAGRSLIGALLFFALAKGRIAPSRFAGRWQWLGIISYALVVSIFVIATRLTTAANAIILEYTAPLWIAVIAWAAFDEKPSVRDGLALLTGGAGVVLCMQQGLTLFANGQMLSKALLGDGLALFTGLLFALTTISLRRINNQSPGCDTNSSSPAVVTLFYGNLLVALIGLPWLIADIGAPAVKGQPFVVGLLVLLWLGVGSLTGGYWCFQAGLKTTRALTASLLLLIEPVLNPLWVALIVHEAPSRGTIAGAVFVLVSLIISLTNSADTR